VLVLPGDVWRTPILKWIIRDQDGVPPRFMPPGYCGNRNVLMMSALCVLAPGGTRRMTLAFPFGQYQFHKGRHQVRLMYENRPGMLGGLPLGADDCEAVRLLRESTPC